MSEQRTSLLSLKRQSRAFSRMLKPGRHLSWLELINCTPRPPATVAFYSPSPPGSPANSDGFLLLLLDTHLRQASSELKPRACSHCCRVASIYQETPTVTSSFPQAAARLVCSHLSRATLLNPARHLPYSSPPPSTKCARHSGGINH